MLWPLVYLTFLLLCGFAVVLWLGKGFSRLEILGLSACLGPAIAGFCMIAASMLGYAPSAQEIGRLAILAVASIIAYAVSHRRKVRLVWSPQSRLDYVWSALAILVVSYGVIVIGRDAFFSPAVSWDAYTTFQFKAKILAHEPMIPRPGYFFNPNLSYSHLRYPLLVPMISAGAMVLGSSQDGSGKPPAVLLYLGLALFFFASLRRTHGSFIAAVVTAFLITLPPFLLYGGAGAADLPLTAFYACSIICLLRWVQNRSWPDLILAALFSAAMTWTKNEGLPMALINGMVILLFTGRPRWSRTLAASAIFAIILCAAVVPWELYIRDFPRTDEDYGSRFTVALIIENLHRLPEVASYFFGEMINFNHWNGIWIATVAVALLNYENIRQKPVLTLWTLLLLQLGVLAIAYMVSVWKLSELIPISIDRLLLHATPAAALLLAYQWRPARLTQHDDFPKANGISSASV